jgi:hypothetical protein
VRVRYEIYCGGRLLRLIEQLDVTTWGDLADDDDVAGAPADGIRFVDGPHYWKIDEQRVAEDVAQAMLAKHGDPGPVKTTAKGRTP